MDASSDCQWDGGSQNSEAHRQELAATKDVAGTRQWLTQRSTCEGAPSSVAVAVGMMMLLLVHECTGND